MRAITLAFALIAIAMFAGTGAKSVPAAPNDLFPTNFTIGCLYIYNIQWGPQESDLLYAFSAQGIVNLNDSTGSMLYFGVTGEFGFPFTLGFSAKQNGTWSPFPTKDLQLDFLTLSYNSTTGTATASGGAVFGGWTLEVDFDYAHQTGAAIGFVVTDAKPSFNDMPGAPAHAYDALNSLVNVGLVHSSYDGSFHFVSGATVTVHTGTNLFAASVFDGVTIQYTGSIHFAGGFAVVVTATADNFQLGAGLAVSSAVLTVQYPAQPFLSLTVAATWTAGLSFTLQGTLSTTDVQFTGNAPGPWQINHGSTPVIVSQMLLTFDYTFASKSTTGELRGAVQWGTLPQIEGIMKYPADPQALGCFSLTVIIGTPSSGPSTLDGIVEQAVGKSGASSQFPPDSKELFGNTLQSVTLSVYPDCGALYLGATLQSTTFGTVNMNFALFEYAPVASVLNVFSAGLPDDPAVPISAGSGYTVGAREVLASTAAAFETLPAPILVPKAYIVRQAVGKAMGEVVSTASSMRQQLLVQLTEHAVQVDCLALLNAATTAMAGESWKAPDTYPNSTWEWEVSLQMTGAHWPLSEPAGVYLTAASFALASASFQMTVGDSSIMAQVGFNFLADIDVSQSSLAALGNVKSVDACASKTFQVSGYIGNNQTGWFLQGALTDGCISFGPNLQLSSTSLRVQSADPQVSFETVMTLPQTQNMQFEVSAVFGEQAGSTTVSISGNSQSVYHTHVGVKELEIDNCNIQLTVTLGASGAFQGSMSGAITIDEQTEISASTSFDSTSKDLTFACTLHEDKPVLMFNLLKLLIGEDEYNKIPMPDSGKTLIGGVYFVQGQMSLASNPPALSGGIQVIGLYKFLVSASFAFNDGKVSFGFSVQQQSGMLDPIKLSDILPNITITDEFRMRTPVIAIANSPAALVIPGIQATFSLQTGFNFMAYLALDTTTARSTQLTKWLGNNSVLVQGVIDPAEADFSLVAQAALDRVTVAPGVDLTSAGFFITVKAPQLSCGFNAQANLQLAPSAAPSNILIVAVTFDVGTDGASFSATVTGPWNTPFGIHGVTFLSGHVDLKLGGSSWGLAAFDLTGTVQVGNVQGSVTFIADGLVLSNTVLAASLQGVSLEKDILQAICGKVPAGMFADAAMQKVTFSINPSLSTIQSYPPGVALTVNNFVIGPITLQTVSFAVDPLLGVRIEIDYQQSGTPTVTVGANGLVPLNNWAMILDLMLSADMGVHVHGQLALLGVQTAANVDISLTQFALAFNFTSGPLTATLAGGVAVASGGDPFAAVDLSLSGSLDMNGYLSQRLLYYAQQTEDTKGPEIKAIQSKIDGLNADIANLQNEINQRSQNDTAAKQAAEQAVQNAQAAVDQAKSKVADLNQQIADAQQKLNQCGKFDYACQAKYKAEILTLQAALATANAALDAATVVLNAALDALHKIPDPDVDPQIIAWKAEVVADQGLIATLQGTLDADIALTNLASKVLTAGAAALQPTSVSFSATSFIGIKGGSPGTAQIVGNFLGKPITLDVGMWLNNAEQFVSDTWTALQKYA